ncbi:MAG TPA: tRNA (adenosine(37)-N6)-dimethylallyltransferase MiaA, partial [Candidatus Methylomirabilis sp.]|nr:tRNA (adenosine(37)-N6)-dimethylallyltransferase MiaA [Candidatus Methylomirabilis sp.]
AVLVGRSTEAEALRLMVRDTIRYAKRQMTWFARDPEIRWIDMDRAGAVERAAECILTEVIREGMIE